MRHPPSSLVGGGGDDARNTFTGRREKVSTNKNLQNRKLNGTTQLALVPTSQAEAPLSLGCVYIYSVSPKFTPINVTPPTIPTFLSSSSVCSPGRSLTHSLRRRVFVGDGNQRIVEGYSNVRDYKRTKQPLLKMRNRSN